MNWQEDHKKRLSQFPNAIRQANLNSSNHYRQIEGIVSCGCFCCCGTFTPTEITKCVDEDANGIGLVTGFSQWFFSHQYWRAELSSICKNVANFNDWLQ